ncbi:hypothetical protein BDV96DRAFT_654711 [Lophiotrema nucula]|uniref:Uncharacterized protein n=1 Tax=Lophiotrema nucula TaxID=690887 RepID=A0A6A5YJL0_9PLEO|nr:hypothetical protein BDV96DRAFT_654711 [Lophiotrema nucula]
MNSSDPNLLSPLEGLNSKIQYFALPYGAIGFVANLLANWAVLKLISEESPWKNEELKHYGTNFYFATLGLFGGSAVSLYNAYRCRHYWPLVLISIWKGVSCAIINGASMVANWSLHKGENNSNEALVYMWYPFALIMGFVGMGVVIEQGWEDQRMKIVVSLSIVALIGLMFCMRFFIGRDNPGQLQAEFWEWSIGFLMALCIMGGMACDWVLAVAADNMDGVPRGGDMETIAIYAYYIVSLLVSLGNA